MMVSSGTPTAVHQVHRDFGVHPAVDQLPFARLR
jgi:hypothetical protein